MYDHHIKDMATSLVEAGLATDREQVELVLSQYWADKVAVVWTTEDVHSVQDDFDENEQTSSLSEEQAQSVLQKAFDKHDASEGITWESLRYWSEEICS
ncbi:hypothetical protein [Chlorogloea sp. CCALA 695]|uniref:hypothetical protein n=1 Tax=Chlorogloea sp. CCALA 695 TaxID=2107693 RepID=UPI000D053E7A|nr:hypothetical protein [Chlorogloea sp. CCALA 695]PSB31377.1 hypothetical protein C7B70_13685 [Chlorogloea sp. CCALA 695]